MADLCPEATAVTRDAFFGGRVTLSQPAKGHRSGTDAVLLAAAVPRGFAGRVFDAGAGVGAVGLGIASASPDASVTLIENDETCVALATANIAANGFGARVTVAACDLLSRDDRRARLTPPADLVVTNPPFHRPDRVRASPDGARRAAHVLADPGGLEAWLLACLACLDDRGTLIVVHHAAALPEMLTVLDRRLGDFTLMPVLPRPDRPATRVLLRGTKGSRAPFQIAPPLVLHEGERFTAEAAALHAGTAGLAW
jgi:tRNA1(Val) A37 N6-methylase TrmN6